MGMKVVRSFGFGNKHIRVLGGSPTLAEMVDEGYNVLYGRQYGADNPTSPEGGQYGRTWTTINTLIVFSLGGWIALANEIDKANGASGQYTLNNATILLTEGKYGGSLQPRGQASRQFSTRHVRPGCPVTRCQTRSRRTSSRRNPGYV
jgi:hypothetical protein